MNLGEFLQISNDVAHRMISEGIREGDVVAIRLGRCPEHYACRLAAVILGAVPVSIDPSIPADRVKAICDLCSVSMMIEDTFFPLLHAEDFIDVPDIDDERPGFLIFTSGSTGVPKVIVHSRGTLVHFDDYFQEMKVDFSDIHYMSIASVSFIVSWLEFFVPLIRCIESHLIDDGLRGDILAIRDYIKVHRIGLSVMNPTYYRAIGIDFGPKTVVLAGEKPGRFPKCDARIFNCYGSSEAIIGFGISKGDDRDIAIDSCVRGSLIELQDYDGNVSDEGEIVYRGQGIMSGYISSASDICRLVPLSEYRTNDIAHRTSEGIFITGRKGDMVKINGQRVEPAETEIAIESIEGVDRAAVKAFNDSGTYLCAYYVSSRGIDEETIISIISKRLSKYQLPKFIRRFDSLPLNNNGKIDRMALETLRSASSDSGLAENEEQRLLCESFAKVLKLDSVGVDDDFFRLGGDSLKAMQLQSILPFRVEITDIFTLHTPRKIAETVKDDIVSRYTFDDLCPLTSSQNSVFLDILSGNDGTAYNNPVTMDMGSDCDPELLSEALNKVIDAHPILKGHVILKDGRPFMSFDSEPIVSFGSELAVEPFDIFEGPLCRFVIMKGESTVLRADIHHLITDGTSLGVLVKDIRKAYGGESIPVDDGILRALTFEEDNKGAIENDLNVFKRNLVDISSLHALIPSVETQDSGILHTHIKVDVERMNSFLKENALTKGALLSSAFAYTLSRFTGGESVFFCTLENGRGHLRLNDAVGMFVKTLPVVIDCSNRNIVDFIRRADKVINSAIACDNVPFHDLNRIFRATADVQFQYGYDLLTHEGLSIDAHEPVSRLSAAVFDDEDGFEMLLTYKNDFNDRFMEDLADVYENVIGGLISCKRLSDIVYTPDEHILVQDRINDTDIELQYGDILDPFLHFAEKTPDKVLVRFDGTSVTFREADELSDAIANRLVSMGIGRGMNVAIMVPRSEWYSICILGVLKAGAAYVPLDIAYPRERIAYLVIDSDSKAILCTPESWDMLSDKEEYPKIDVTQLERAVFEPVEHSPDDNAVVIYSSGTTGVPKGSCLPRRSIQNYCEWHVRHTEMSPDDVYGLYASFGFDAHITGIYAPMYSGGTVDIIPAYVRLDVNDLNDHMVDAGITQIYLPTQVGKLYSSLGLKSDLRLLEFGGEKLGDYIPNESFEAMDEYGPSENNTTSFYVNLKDKLYPSSVGTPVNNVRGYILDKEMRRVPIGAVGELYLSGYQLSNGYINRPELQAKVFKKNQFTKDKGFERMYATGDYLRYLPDGTFGFVGRRDGQVKVRGNRVEVAEVEARIVPMPGVREVTVVPIDTETGAKELCAYIVPEKDAKIDTGTVGAYLSELIPAYMIPTFVVTLEEIPLNVNGKVDMHALPRPDMTTNRAPYAEPRDEVDRALCEIFGEVLQMKQIGIDDDFTLLGGDSIGAIKVMIAYKEHYSSGPSITSADILRLRTPRMINDKLRSSVTVTTEYTVDTGCPLNDAQRSMFEYIRRHPEMCYDYCGRVGWERVKDAEEAKEILEATLESYPIARSRIMMKDGVPWMTFDHSVDMKVCHCDPDSMVEEIKRPIDIVNGPLARFLLCEWEGKVTALFNVHHLIIDGVSLGVLFRSAKDILKGKEVPVDIEFIHSSTFDGMVCEDPIYEQSHDLYRSMSEGAAVDYLPISNKGKKGSKSYPLTVKHRALEKFRKKNGCSVNGLMSYIYGSVLSKVSKRDRCLFYVTLDGRNNLNNYASVGEHAKGVPFSFVSDGIPSKEGLRKVSDSLSAVSSNYTYPLWKMMEEGYDWDIRLQYLSRRAIPQSMLKEFTFTFLNDQDVPTMCDLWTRVTDDSEGLSLLIAWSDKYDEPMIDRIAREFNEMLKILVR